MKTLRPLALCAGVILATGCHPPEDKSAQLIPTPHVDGDRITLPGNSPQLSSVSTEAAAERRSAAVRFTGRLAWNDDVTVRIFSPVAGRVSAITSSLGQVVREGEVLARVMSPDFGQAQADGRKAKADLLLAERNLRRLRELQEHGAAALKDVEAAEDAQSTAQSEMERAQTRLVLYGGVEGAVDQQFPLRTPIGGVVVERNISAGQEVRPDQMLANAPALCAPLFTISNPRKLWLFLDVTELNMADFHPGLRIRLQTKAYPGRNFDGVIDFVGSSLDPATRTVRMRASVDNSEELLKAEMYVNVEVDLAENPVAAHGVDIPAKAVFLQDNLPSVFVESGPGIFSRRPVKIGREVDGKVLAMGGVSAGERVVTEGCLLLQSMMRAKE